MKKALDINGNIFEVDKISAVYMSYAGRTIDGNSIHTVHIVIDSVDVIVYEDIDVSKIHNKIANVIAGNAEIIEII